MRIKFERDWNGPVFGFATKVREFDKLFCFALSAAGVLGISLVLDVFLWSVPSVALASVLVFAFGLGVELEHGAERAEADKDGCILGPGGRGFSWLCLAADLGGVLLACLFFWRL